MRLHTTGSGYTLWLSKNDTYDWANRPGKRWPCSTLANRRIRVDVDSNGLCGLTVDGKHEGYEHIDGREIDAVVADHTNRDDVRAFWPRWES